MHMLDYIIKGGVMMLPLVLCSVLALGIVLERLWSMRRKRVLRYNLLQRLEDLLREQKIPEATTLCKRHQSTLTRILLVMLLNHDRPKTEIKEMIEENSRQEVPVLERYLTALGTIANIAPFLGLLGTVVGLLKIFEAIAQQGTTNAALISDGIYNALITTVAGLCVAIPTLVAYNHLMRKAEELTLEVERVALRLLNILKR
jgi:biopolymer transport protein ExbB